MARAKKLTDDKRDARINLAFTTELKVSLERIAALNDISLNSLIESICKSYVESHADVLSEYEKMRAQLKARFIAPAQI